MDATSLWHYTGWDIAGSTGAPIAALLGSVFFLSAMFYAAQRDLRTMSIPNGLVVAMFLGWSVLAPVAGLTPRDMTLSVGSAAMVFFASAALYAMGWMGGGDSKLITVAALWLGAGHVVAFLFATMLAGAVIGLGLLALRFAPRPLAAASRIVSLQRLATTEMPYALAIGLGALTIYPRTFWVGAM